MLKPTIEPDLIEEDFANDEYRNSNMDDFFSGFGDNEFIKYDSIDSDQADLLENATDSDHQDFLEDDSDN